MINKNQNPDRHEGDPPQPQRTIYQTGEGPTSIDGVEASQLPDKGRGAPETSPAKELSRKIPSQTGGQVGNGTDTGIAAMPDAADSRDHGHRKHN